MSTMTSTPKTRTASIADRKARYVNEYRNAAHGVESSTHKANVSAVAYFKTLPQTVEVKTAKKTTTKPVGAIERARQTIEALCVKVERGADGKVKRGDDVIGYTPARLTQIVEAFENAETVGVIKVENLAAKGGSKPNAEEVEALVSGFDQFRKVAGTAAAKALASEVRDGGADSVEVVAAEVASKVADARAAAKSQEVKAPVTKTPAQVVGDAVTALTTALEENAASLDAGQKSALLAKVEALSLFLK